MQHDQSSQHEVTAAPPSSGFAEPQWEAVAPHTAPPERVRFSAPVKLKRESVSRSVEGAVVNLSVHGIACLAPIILDVGDRVWVTFKLNLAQKPLTLLCEVIWKGPPSDDYSTYGLRFTSLTREEAHNLTEAVRERTEGRAGAWPLPIIPEGDEPPPPTASDPSPVTLTAAGLVAGIGLAVLVSVIASDGSAMLNPEAGTAVAVAPLSKATEPEATGKAPPTSTTPAPGIQIIPSVYRELTDQKVSRASPQTAPASPRVPTDVVAEAAEAPPASTAERLPKRAPHLTARDTDVLRPLGGAGKLELALLTDGPVDQHVTFWLSQPRRLVIDIPNRKSGFARHIYGIEHPLATRLRVGEHATKVRYVLETSEDVNPELIATTRGDALIIELQRR